MAKSTQYVLHDPDALNLSFYQGYDENFLYNKAVALMYIVNEREHFKEQITQFEDLKHLELNDKFFESLRAELHFTEIHQFEGFFALLIAIYQELPHWLYLTTYRDEVKDGIKMFLNRDFSQLTSGSAANERDFIMQAIYSEFTPSDEEMKKKWDENLDNTAWLLRRMAEKYLDAMEYNAYKHGLRVMTGPSVFQIRLQDQEGRSRGPAHVVGASEDSLRFLELEKDEKQPEQRIVHETTKHFSPQESFFDLCKMQQMLETIKTTRLALLLDQPEIAQLNTSFGLDRNRVIQLRKHFRFSRTI